MKQFRFFPVFLLCAAPFATPISSATAEDAAKTPAATTEAPKTIFVRDADANRAIEVVTDRPETVSQFFARQKLVLVDNANTNGKFWSVPQIVNGDASKVFVSYPLQNDQGFRLYRYGDFYNLEKPSPDVSRTLAIQPKLDWKNTMLIFAVSTDDADGKKTDDALNKTARLVGRILVKDRAHWRPEMDAETLKYQQSDAKAEDADKE